MKGACNYLSPHSIALKSWSLEAESIVPDLAEEITTHTAAIRSWAWICCHILKMNVFWTVMESIGEVVCDPTQRDAAVHAVAEIFGLLSQQSPREQTGTCLLLTTLELLRKIRNSPSSYLMITNWYPVFIFIFFPPCAALSHHTHISFHLKCFECIHFSRTTDEINISAPTPHW